MGHDSSQCGANEDLVVFEAVVVYNFNLENFLRLASLEGKRVFFNMREIFILRCLHAHRRVRSSVAKEQPIHSIHSTPSTSTAQYIQPLQLARHNRAVSKPRNVTPITPTLVSAKGY